MSGLSSKLSSAGVVWAVFLALTVPRVTRAALTGLALPPLDVPASQYGGAWASANSMVFIDLMKHSTPFTTAARRAGSSDPFPWYLDPKRVTWRPDGYPAGLNPPAGDQWAATTTIGAGGAYYSAGRYVVLYDGNGSVELDGDASVPPVSSAPGRLEVDVKPSATGLRVRITASSSSNPVTRIRIVPVSYETTYDSQIFHPDFLNLLQGIPLLRFSPWMAPSNDPNNPRLAPRDWAARTTPTHSSQVRDSDGVAVEHLVQLANAVHAHMWISLPRVSPASNDTNPDPYVFGMVLYIATHLAPGLGVTVEYGSGGPGWISTHLPTSTRGITGVARAAWGAAGRPAGQLRLVMAAPFVNAVANILSKLPASYPSWLDAVALPASFGGGAYFSWSGRTNPTAWDDPTYFLTPGRPTVTLDRTLTFLRSSVIAADVSYNQQYQILSTMGLQVLGYAGGPQLLGPSYGARANYDHVATTCPPPPAATTWPCSFSNLYPPWTYSGGPTSIRWATLAARNVTLRLLAVNASREASLESVLRQARGAAAVYDMVLDSLWRWHDQMGGGDVIVDVTRLTQPCANAPGKDSPGRMYAPDECRTPAAATPVSRPDVGSPTYRALRAWLAGGGTGTAVRGALPKSAAEAPPAVPLPKACTPACVYGTCSYNGTCACWVGASGPTCSSLSPGSTPSSCNPRVGVNLEGVSDWSRTWAWADPFKTSREWIPQRFKDGPWNSGEPISLITSPATPAGPTGVGYPAALAPGQRVCTLVYRDMGGHAPAGTYTLLYDGKGLLDVGMGDVADVAYLGAGHMTVTFKPSTDFNNGILLTLERTDPSDPLHNIRLLTPGLERAAEAGSPFHPALTAFLRPFGVLRFMDWMQTNSDTLPVNWEDRPKTTDRSYAVSPGGVPVEVMVQLANSLGADPWFNMPHAATDDYVSRFAAVVRDSLRPDLKAYVEYSNEVWHTGFPGGRYAQEMGLALNLTEQGNGWYGGAINEARLCFAAQRTANISKIWKALWGARAGQVVVVISGQAVWPITSDKLLSCGASYKYIDALAIAPYFGLYDKSRDKSLDIFMSTTLPAQTDDVIKDVKQHAAIAAKYGKPLLSYEAGQGLIGDGTSGDLAIQANRHPAMSGLYRTYLERLAAEGVSRVVHFSSITSYSKYGSWGLLEAQDQDRVLAPKFQGVMSYISSNLQCPLPLPPAPASCPGATPGGAPCGGHGQCLAGGSCLCYSGYSGADCSNVTYTEVYNCGYRCTFDQGWCNVSSVSGLTRTWGCTCKPGITGLTCAIHSCPKDCSWNGDCIDQGICACYPGYDGADCSTDCGCGGHGRCDGKGGCICDVGWRRSATSGKCEWDCSGCDAGAGCIGPGECGCADTCVYGTCIAGRCRCWAGYGGPACNISDADPSTTSGTNVTFVPRANRGSLAGINLAGLSYYSTEWVWTDVMKGSSRWYTSYKDDTSRENAFDTGTPLELRPDGYPARLPYNVVAHKLMLRDVQLHAWPGRYVVLYDGDGRLDFNYDAVVLSRSKGRLEIQFTPTADLTCATTGAAYCGDNGLHLTLAATNPDNPLRNVRILPSAPPEPTASAASAGGPGGGGAWESRHPRTPFHPWFLRSVARYRTLRFTSWLNVNANGSSGVWAAGSSSSNAGWSGRPTPSSASQAGEGGVAVEHVVQLCNLVGADPWVSVPHTAGDDVVAALAAMLRDGLRPDVNLYVEHSNEVWNSLFPQHAYASARGLQLGLSTDPRVAAYRYHALRTTQIGDLFRAAFATAPGGGAGRVRVVLGGWGYLCGTGGTGCGAEVMRESLGWQGTAGKVDYYGVTAYWDCGLGVNGPLDALLSVEQMIAKCDEALPGTEAAARALVAAAAPYGTSLLTYEAGPSLVEAAAMESGSVTEALTPKLVGINRHPQMYRLYGSYLQAFVRAGLVGEGRPWMQFASTGLPGKYGSWGLLEYTGQDPASSPKDRALMDWLDEQQGPTGRRPTCLSLPYNGGSAAGVAGSAGGGMALAEGRLLGPPAVELPAAGMVLLQNRSYVARWSTVGWPTGRSRPLEVTLWLDSDCGDGNSMQQQRSAEQALLTLAAGVALYPAGELTWRVPLPAEAPTLAAAVAAAAGNTGRRDPRFFLRITDGVTTNYSEPFDIQAPYIYVPGAWANCTCTTATTRRSLTCLTNTGTAPPDQSPPPPAPTCRTFRGWTLTPPPDPADPICTIDAVTGCRTYRTDNTGKWSYSVFKSVTDCTAQTSPWPRPSTAAPVTLPQLAAKCVAAGLQAPPVSRMCTDAEYAAACPGWVRSPPPSPPSPRPPPSPKPFRGA